ncbi:hypothetical protein AOLI_G00238780 [Acnodon oligacanthus]
MCFQAGDVGASATLGCVTADLQMHVFQFSVETDDHNVIARDFFRGQYGGVDVLINNAGIAFKDEELLLLRVNKLTSCVLVRDGGRYNALQDPS